jgi:glucosyl-dolichyl phosphate glucuronosyltransferase
LKVSVVIATHNRAKSLEKTLESLRVMDRPAGLPWEVRVVDNGSSDATPAVVEAAAARFGPVPVRRVFETRAGVAFARNAGVESASGEIIAFVDDDVLVGRAWLSVIERAFDEDKELAVLGGRLKPNPESPMPKWLDGLNTAPLGLIDYGDARIQLDFPYLATANCAFRKSAIVSAGMFNVRLGRQPKKLYSDEDTDMIARVLADGGKIVYDPELAALHFVPNARMTKAYFRRWYRERGEGVGLIGANQSRALFGIAFYEYRALLGASGMLLRNFVSFRPTFQQELFLVYFAGIVAGRLKSGRTAALVSW